MLDARPARVSCVIFRLSNLFLDCVCAARVPPCSCHTHMSPFQDVVTLILPTSKTGSPCVPQLTNGRTSIQLTLDLSMCLPWSLATRPSAFNSNNNYLLGKPSLCTRFHSVLCEHSIVNLLFLGSLLSLLDLLAFHF